MDDKWKRAIEEVRALAESDRLADEREYFINDNNLTIHGHQIGRLDDIPVAAQAYIKMLRETIWNMRHKDGR